METIELMTKLFFISWLITRFEPLQMILELLPDKLITNLIKLLLSCLKCVFMWMTLLTTGSIFLAAVGAFVAFWYDKFISPIENKVRL